jgi:hypothetical protein
MISLKLYNASGTSLTAKGRITDVGMDFNPQGQPVASKKYSIAFHISDFSSIASANENYKDWQAEFVNSESEIIQGRLNNPLVDKTFGYVVATLTLNHPSVVL